MIAALWMLSTLPQAPVTPVTTGATNSTRFFVESIRVALLVQKEPAMLLVFCVLCHSVSRVICVVHRAYSAAAGNWQLML